MCRHTKPMKPKSEMTLAKTHRILCEPTWKCGVFIPPISKRKFRCLIAGYYKLIGCYSHERQFVMEYETEDD